MKLSEYAAFAIERGASCWNCHGTVSAAGLHHRPHPDGWIVDGMRDRQWLYFTCPKPDCRYETSFHKLGIERPVPIHRRPEPEVTIDDMLATAAIMGLTTGASDDDPQSDIAPDVTSDQFEGFGGGESGGGGGGASWDGGDSGGSDAGGDDGD